ncbi:MAG: hypothetical protein AB7R90_06990 [Reyranellaceae bacterium]
MIGTRFPYRFAAVALAAMGIVAILYWLVHPLAADGSAMPRDEAYWQTRAGAWNSYANLLFVALMLAGLAASGALALILRDKAQPLAGLSLIGTLPGHVLLASAGIFNAYVAAALAADPATRGLLDLKGPLLGGPLHGAFGLGGMLFYGGWLALGAALKKAGLIGWWTTLAFVPGAAAVAMHPMLPFAFRLAGFAIFGLACLRVSVACWRSAGREAQAA